MASARDELADLWRSITREMHDAFREAFRGHELPPITLILFRNIHAEPGITMSELARRSGIVKSHVSKMVDQLVKQGFIEKRHDPEDQRLVRLYLTATGVDSTLLLKCRAQAVINSVVSELPEAEVEEIVRGLRTLRDALQKLNEKVNK